MSIHQFAVGGSVTAPPATRVAYAWPFASDSAWNLPIASSATFADNTQIRLGSANINSTIFTARIVQAASTDPTVVVTGGGAATLKVPAGVTGSPGSDGALVVIGPDGHTQWDFYRFARTDNTHATADWVRQSSLNDVVTGSGFGNPDTHEWGGTNAAGSSMAGGIMRASELSTPAIDRMKHVLQVGFAAVQAKQAATLEGTYQWPAVASDAGWAAYTGTIFMGSLLAIPPSVDINGLGLPNADALALAWTMQNFGCYMIDTGGSAPGNAILRAEYGATESIVNNMRAGWTAIRNQLRIVSNSTRATPAGKTAAGTYPPALYPAPTPIAVAH